MLKTDEITLEKKEQIDRIRRKNGHDSASHSFDSLFLWQRDMDLSLCLREHAFAVRCAQAGDNAWFFPCGSPDEIALFVQDILAEGHSAQFLYARDEDVELLEHRFPGMFHASETPESSEYLYDRAKYVSMSGKDFANIRWSVNRLKSHHKLAVEPLNASNMDEARGVFARWVPRVGNTSYSTDHETAPLLLEHIPNLDIDGIIVYMDDQPEAVVAGFPLSERSYDLAFAKAVDRENGLLHFARRSFVSTLPEQYTIINGEEDLGIPGLRNAKLLERPIGQIKMYEISTIKK